MTKTAQRIPGVCRYGRGLKSSSRVDLHGDVHDGFLRIKTGIGISTNPRISRQVDEPLMTLVVYCFAKRVFKPK